MATACQLKMLNELRLRLTMMYLLLGLGLVAALSGVSYGLLKYYFQSSADQALKIKMGLQMIEIQAPIPADLYNSISNSGLVTMDSPAILAADPATGATHALPEEQESNHRLLEESQLADIFVIPLNIQGAPIVGQTSAAVPFQSDTAAFLQAIKYGSDIRTIQASDGTPIRILTYRVPAQAGIAALQVGKSLKSQMDLLTQLLRGLILIGMGSVFIIATGAWFLSGKSIQPATLALEKQQTFVANASHELRAPLTLIRAGIEVAGREPVTPKQKQVLEDSLADVDYMKKLLDDLLLLSRLDAHSVALEKEQVQFPEFLDRFVRKMTPIASASGIVLSSESSSFVLYADPNRLQQVLFILMDNAIRHNLPGGWVKLSASASENLVHIIVQDSGKGIPEEHLEKVFDRFYKVEDGSRSAQKGSGLGLSIARGLVEAHHGRIKLTSTSGVGTTVTVTLPLTGQAS